jgi:hypothetical protein
MAMAKRAILRTKIGRQASAVLRKPAATLHGAEHSLEQPSLRRLLDKSGNVQIQAVSASFGISKHQLAETIGLSREALYKQQRASAPKTQRRLLEMLEIIDRITDWAGGRKQALAWYRAQPIPAFGGRTAESLVKTGDAAALRDYLDHIALGGYA